MDDSSKDILFVVANSKDTVNKLILGAIATGFTLIFNLIDLTNSFSFKFLLLTLFIALFEFLLISACITSHNFKIEVYQNTIILKRAFKKDKSFSYSSIISANRNRNIINICLHDGDKFSLTSNYTNMDLFLKRFDLNNI